MCGLFGFVAKKGFCVDLSVIKDAADLAAVRGGDAHGFSKVCNGHVYTYKSPGCITDNMDALDWLKGATSIVGHTRFSTSGHWSKNENNQPIQYGSSAIEQSFVIAHNGTLGNYTALSKRMELPLTTGCDSEVIGLLLQMSEKEKLEDRIKDACYMMRSSMGGVDEKEGQRSLTPNFAVTYMDKDRVILIRDGNPLQLTEKDEGIYWCSVEIEKGSVELPNFSHRTFPVESNANDVGEYPKILRGKKVKTYTNTNLNAYGYSRNWNGKSYVETGQSFQQGWEF